MTAAIVIAAVLAWIGTLVDGLQTVQIARLPGVYMETNPLLGPHPSVCRVRVYFAHCLVVVAALPLIFWQMHAHAVQWAALPWLIDWPLVSLVVMIWIAGTEWYWVRHNYRYGIRL